LHDEKNFYRDLIDNLYDGIYFVDRARVITYWNKGAERITGYSAADAIGRGCRDSLLNHVTADGVQLCKEHCPLAAVMQDGKPRESEVYLHHADGHRIPVRVRATALRDENGNILGAIEAFSSNASVVRARREAHEMRRAAFTDALTGIGNRKHLEGRLSAAVAEFQQNGADAGMLFLDVDHFKKFNDLHGHDVGDKVLQMVAKTLHHGVRGTDTTGRWGGEEFVVILYGVTNAEDLLRIAEKLRMLVEYSSLTVAGHSIAVSVSIGGTRLLPTDTAESVIRRADELMYESKRSGRNKTTIG
jgi:diguanylate cyclase (GGDEF)-like protein/PAS domain S-box-containing protein